MSVDRLHGHAASVVLGCYSIHSPFCGHVAHFASGSGCVPMQVRMI